MFFLLLKIYNLLIALRYTPRVLSGIIGRRYVSSIQLWLCAISWTNFITLQWLIKLVILFHKCVLLGDRVKVLILNTFRS